MSKEAMTDSRWPNLRFSESGLERLKEVEETNLPAGQLVVFYEKLAYLDGYGGPVSDEDPRRRFRVHLHSDWAPLSFSLVWERLSRSTGEYVYGWNGGFIYHAGSNDPLCVSLTPQIWGIHT
jgi:hypothetical protein